MDKQRHPLRFMRAIPIRWRLALVSLGLLTLLISALGVIVSFIAEQALVTNEVNVLQNEAQVASKGVMKDFHTPPDRPFELGSKFYPSGPPSEAFNRTALSLLTALNGPNHFNQDTNIYATVLTPQGKNMLLDGSPSPFIFPPLKITPGLVQQIISTSTPYTLVKNGLGQKQLVVFIPLVKSYRTIGILEISTPTAFIDNFLATFHTTLFLGIIGTLGLAIALIFPLVSMALRPLIEIERTSRRIAQGELSMRIDQPLTDDEIGRLARSFNRMVARLEAAFQKQKRFVGDVSHELRTPLTALSGSLEMLLIGADLGDPEASRRLARGMFAEVQRMHRMVEDLLALTRLDEGELKLRRTSVSVETVLHTVYEQARHLANNQELHYLVEPDLPPVCVDSDRLQQILLNLVDNALKFTPSDGMVALQAARGPQNTVVITISDTGQGIPSDALPYVFDRFYRVDPARSRSSSQASSGSGLGLSIVRELVEAQEGAISIHSVAGEGTNVLISFPALPQPERTRRQEKKCELQDTKK